MEQKAQQGRTSEELISQHDFTSHQPLVQYSSIFIHKATFIHSVIQIFDVEHEAG
jgi:hypothetical protein